MTEEDAARLIMRRVCYDLIGTLAYEHAHAQPSPKRHRTWLEWKSMNTVQVTWSFDFFFVRWISPYSWLLVNTTAGSTAECSPLILLAYSDRLNSEPVNHVLFAAVLYVPVFLLCPVFACILYCSQLCLLVYSWSMVNVYSALKGIYTSCFQCTLADCCKLRDT